ncbi:MAG: hypothetical protein VYB54_04030 [Pseudomonadota bacterium]|nr:hypothetical protein [Pseudomonadota bacterium]
MRGTGFLAIWSDVAADREVDYLHWLTREHAQERLGVPGFLAVRVFRAAIEAGGRYFILYELADRNVVGSPAYLARLNAPTPWSQRIMPILGNFRRGGGTVVASAGSGQGGLVVPLRLTGPTDFPVATLAGVDGIVAARLLQADNARSSIKTDEKRLRGGDDSFERLLLLEATGPHALDAMPEPLAGAGVEFADFEADFALRYAQVFGLTRDQVGLPPA